MIRWMLETIGIESDITSRLEHAQWALSQPLALWLGAVLLVPIGWFIYRRHRRNLPQVSPLFRGILTTCRIGILAILVVVLAGPEIRVQEPAQQKPILAILIDESESMQLPAGPFAVGQTAPLALAAGVQKQLDSMPRRELVGRLLQTQAPVLAQLSRRCEVRYYRFAQSALRSSLEDVRTPRPPELGQTTAIGAALQLAVAEASGQPLAGMVVISDGRVTAGPNPQHLVGEDGEAGGVPIWSVAAGSQQGLDDISLLSVIAPPNIPLGDRVEIVATIRARGFAGLQADVELLDGEQVLERSQITLGSGEEQRVMFRLQAQLPGKRLLTVRVEAKPGEIVTRNNQQQVTLEVDRQKWQVLYLEGWPRWDFRFLDHAFRRDHGITATMVMESQLRAKRQLLADAKKKPAPDAAPAEQDKDDDKALPPLSTMAALPADAAGFAKFDVIVLGDISPELLTPRHQEALVSAVKEHGVGLILQAGTQHMPHAYRDMPLGQLMPLEAAAAESGKGGMAAEAFSPFALSVTDDGFLYPAFRPYDQLVNNREIWDRMPELHWAMNARETSSTTRILAEIKTIDGKQPLIAERYAGKGRVFLIGTDSTYRWKKNIGDQLFYPFWGRTVRQLARSRARQKAPSWIEVYPRRAELGEAVDIELYAIDKDRRPLTAAHVEVAIGAAGKPEPEAITLESCGQPGWFRGVWQPARVGDFRLQYTDLAGKAASAQVRVAPSGREYLRPSVDWQSFGQLAEASNGGSLLKLHEFARLQKLVQGQPTEVVRNYEAQLWDNWLILMILVCAFCTDLVIRRLLSLA